MDELRSVCAVGRLEFDEAFYIVQISRFRATYAARNLGENT